MRSQFIHKVSRKSFAGMIGAAFVSPPSGLSATGDGAGSHRISPAAPPVTYSKRRKPSIETKRLTVGCLIFPRQDQIDFTGPFEVFSRIPDCAVHVMAKTREAIHDIKGLLLTPDISFAEAPPLDVLMVSGGLGQQEVMHDEEMLALIRNQANSGGVVFSVCTGALLCGAAGVLRGRMATTHWAAWDLLPYYGATPVKSRVVVDGNIITCAGVTAGLDGSLLVASLLRGNSVAEEIQLEIEYAPRPVFHSGDPETASPDTVRAFLERYQPVKASRQVEAQRFSEMLRVQRK